MIRRYQHGDHMFIGQIFYDAVHQLACEDYSREQLQAWASKPIGFDHWQQRCETKKPFVKEFCGQVVGFIELDADGHIDCTYVDPNFARRGVMTELMHAVKMHARKRKLTQLYAEVSITAKPFFIKHGFEVVGQNKVEIKDVTLTNFNMTCQL
ncbi:MAG: GNAT family N-acetyltransferase [Phycisphaeraceae bacterium JB051]